MKLIWMLAAVFLSTSGVRLEANQTASATMYCWSLRFQQGEGPFDETLDLTTVNGVPNGELAPWYSTYTHRSTFVLDYSGFPISGNFYLDLPVNADANSNGFDDSFEVSQPVSGSSAGQFTSAFTGGGTVSATWSRAAGSKLGTCWLHLVDNSFGDLGTYQHTFEVLEYTGALTYQPATNVVNASLALNNATGQINGPASFTKSSTNAYNELSLAAGTWTNGALQLLTFTTGTFLRDPAWPTNYYGMIVFTDGDLNTSGPDYQSWELSLDDLNDSDHDGIPDFSDEPAPPRPRRPLLKLAVGPSNLLLTISGDTNNLCHVLTATNIGNPAWTTNLSLTLTNDPQTVSLPLPAGPVRFWRASMP